jgi:hypothetical protein
MGTLEPWKNGKPSVGFYLSMSSAAPGCGSHVAIPMRMEGVGNLFRFPGHPGPSFHGFRLAVGRIAMACSACRFALRLWKCTS